jgi:hypothetical protein
VQLQLCGEFGMNTWADCLLAPRESLSLLCRRNHCHKLLGPLIQKVVESYLDEQRLKMLPAETPATDYWCKLYCAARIVDEVHWSPLLPDETHQADSSCQHAKGKHLLARCCHSATAAGSYIVLLGGIFRDGSPSHLDVCVLDVVHGRIIQPQLLGEHLPPALSHMCQALISLHQGSVLHSLVSQDWQS